MTKMLDITCSALFTALMSWTVAFALHYMGFEQGFNWVGAAAMLWSIIGVGCLIVAAVWWVIRHVRITIV